MLTTLFPVNSAPSTECEPSTIPLTNSPGGSLWSYISQVDSTPALSFSWRHSAAQQRFLHSLRIDSVLQVNTAAIDFDLWVNQMENDRNRLPKNLSKIRSFSIELPSDRDRDRKC